MTIDDICRDMDFVAPAPINPNNESIIKVIGVGGGGGNAVGYMYNLGVKDVRFVVCNTDKQTAERKQRRSPSIKADACATWQPSPWARAILPAT